MRASFFFFGRIDIKSEIILFGDSEDFDDIPYGRSVTMPSILSLIFLTCSYLELMILELYPFTARFFFATPHIFLSKSIPTDLILIDSASKSIVPVPQKGSHKISSSFNPERFTIALLSFQFSSKGDFIIFFCLFCIGILVE